MNTQSLRIWVDVLKVEWDVTVFSNMPWTSVVGKQKRCGANIPSVHRAPRLELRVWACLFDVSEAGVLVPSGYWCLYVMLTWMVCMHVCAHTCKYTPSICKSLIFMRFLFREKRKYLLHTKHCINDFMLKRKWDGHKVYFSNKESEAPLG